MSRPTEGVTSLQGRWIARYCYGLAPLVMRPWLRRWVMRLEHGPVYSCSVREILAKYHGVTVGMYTIGPCETDPEQFAPGTVIGRYCSIYYTVRVLAEDGPRPVGFDGGPAWDLRALVGRDCRQGESGLIVGHDVYIGHQAIVLPSVRNIGHGAVIGAGSVILDDVPPYAVVTGNPARVVRYRFRPSTIERLLAEQWWWKPVSALFSPGSAPPQPIEVPVR